MAKDWNQREVIALLLELSAQLQKLDAGLGELEEDYVRKAEAYNQRHGEIFIQTKGPQYLRTATADQGTSELKLARDLAKVMVQGQKRKIEILRDRIGIGRTATASLRAELELERVPNQYRR